MTRRILTLLLLLSLPPTLARGQVSERRVREAVDDGTAGLGQAITGGSLPLGAAGTTGRLLGFRVGGSLQATRMEIDDPTRETGTVDFVLPTGSLDAQVGLVGQGETFGGIDLVGRIGPLFGADDLVDTRWFRTLGGRVGLLREASLRPAVTLTLARTWVDGLRWNDPDGEEPTFGADVDVWSVRADAGKTLGPVTPYAGAGLDRTSVEADYRIPAGASTGGSEIVGEISPSGTHGKAYVGAKLDLLLMSLLAEVGRYGSGTFLAARVSLFP